MENFSDFGVGDEKTCFVFLRGWLTLSPFFGSKFRGIFVNKGIGYVLTRLLRLNLVKQSILTAQHTGKSTRTTLAKY